MNQTFLSLVSEYFKFNTDKLSKSSVASDVPGWDSLEHANFIIFLEQELEIEFTLDELIAIDNIGDLSTTIDSKLKG